MNLWLLAFLVACFVDTLAPAVHAQGVFEDCCLAYHPEVQWKLLKQAQSYLRQDVSGSCNLPAVIFYFPRKQKMVCANPKAKWVQDGMKRLDRRNEAHLKHHQGTRRILPGFHSEGKKLRSRTSKLPLSMFREHTRGSQRNTSHLTTANPGG
ncbi:C-C motif chemokine 25 [Rhinolophus sinicus]|uniref:C-C motif chemokine 25 n=1 Tax=Rhinolophus sinicus TaxID=89399 RepID=UPI003D7A67E9